MTTTPKRSLAPIVREIAGFSGAVLLTIGAGLAWLPAGFMAGGVLLLAGAIWHGRAVG